MNHPRALYSLAQEHEGWPLLVAFMVTINFIAGLVIGVSPLPAAAAILLSAGLAVTRILRIGRIPRPAFWFLSYVIFAFVSGILFGGIDAISDGGFMVWVAAEGRVFLYFWPALLVLVWAPRPSFRFDRLIQRVIRSMTVLYAAVIVLQVVVGFSIFSTHHAAGAFGAAFFFYNYFRYDKDRTKVNLVFVLLNGLALLGSNSRTSVLTVVLVLIALLALYGRLPQIWRMLRLIVPIAVLMPLLFPTEFTRLTNLEEGVKLGMMYDTFHDAFTAEVSIEVGKAHELVQYIDRSEGGDTNLTIRLYLWGRAAAEGLRSPLFGAGFGRYNDLGREFEGIRYLAWPALSVQHASSMMTTAHNTFLHTFAELGLIGLLLIGNALYGFWNGYRAQPQTETCVAAHVFWQRVGQASILALLVSGMTQHSLGAPIYGMSLMLMAAIAYTQTRSH